MQKDPDQLAQAVCNGPDGFIVPEARHQTTIEDLEDASFAFDGSIGSLIQNAAHLAVAFGRAFAVVHARAFFLSWACSHPGDEILRCGEGRRRGTYLGNDLLRRVHPQTGDLGQPLDCILMLAKEAGRSPGRVARFAARSSATPRAPSSPVGGRLG